MESVGGELSQSQECKGTPPMKMQKLKTPMQVLEVVEDNGKVKYFRAEKQRITKIPTNGKTKIELVGVLEEREDIEDDEK